MKKLMAAGMLPVLLAALLFCACAGQPAPAQTPAPSAALAFTDMAGREIALAQPAARVVALTASDCEILYAIGAQDTLVGRGEYCDYPPEALAIPAIQSNYEINIEQVLALAPQVVFVEDMDPADEKLKALEAAGITVVLTSAHHEIEGVYKGIRLIGRVMGKEEQAAAVTEAMRAGFTQLAQEAAKQQQGKTVYFEVSPLEYGLWTAGAGTFMDEIAGMLGLANVFADVEGWAQVSEEQVLARDPDYIVTITMYYGTGPTPIEEIMARPGWGNVSAVKSGAILNLQDNTLSRPGPRLAEGARKLYNFVYEGGAS